MDNNFTLKKADFFEVDMVQEALFMAFHPEPLGEDDALDERYLALWNMFLITVGWTEDEYFRELEAVSKKCADCGQDLDDDDLPELKSLVNNQSKPN